MFVLFILAKETNNAKKKSQIANRILYENISYIHDIFTTVNIDACSLTGAHYRHTYTFMNYTFRRMK